jgi:glycosyltransferase involved in cell wall biosynthesis
MKALAIVHRVYIGRLIKPGGLDRFFSFLGEKGGYEIVTIEHPLDLRGETVLRRITKDGIVKDRAVDIGFSFFGPLRLTAELLFNIYEVVFGKKRFDVAFCADPFNLFSGHILKRMGFVRLLVFHSADYSDRRFGNAVLNRIYQSLYRKALKNADVVFAVSIRMFQRCRELLGKDADKVIFFPNAPRFAKTPKRQTRKQANTVILAGHLIRDLDYRIVLEAIADLKARYPRILLKIVGEGEGAGIIGSLVEKMDIRENVILAGALSQEEALREISQSDIGLTCYTDGVTWNFYRDSIKIRDYAACGLPVVSDNTTSTALDAHQHGCCLLYENKEGLKRGISTLLDNKDFYDKTSENALAWARKNDSETIFERSLALILNKLESLRT